MVTVEEIVGAFNNFHVKCFTLSQIHSKLGGLSSEDKHQRLFDGNLLNEAEKDHYINLLKKKENCKHLMEEAEKDIIYAKMMGKELDDWDKELDEKIFKYERRIFDGSKPKDQQEENRSNVDIDEYVTDDALPISDGDWLWDNNLGSIETEMVNRVDGYNLSNDEVDSLRAYFGDDAYLLNSFLNNGKTWNNLSKTEQEGKRPYYNKLSRLLSTAISKETDGLPTNTRLFHAGKFDPSKVVGDHIKFKGFTSASFSEDFIREAYNQYIYDTNGDAYYTYVILAPKGTKGIGANTVSMDLTIHHLEHEYLLDKGFEGDIVDIDVDNHLVYLAP